MFLTSVPGLGWPQTHADWAVTWDAFGAIGTFLAVVVALGFGAIEISRTRRSERNESRENATLLLTRLHFMEQRLEDGTVSRYTPLQIINASSKPFLDIHLVQKIDGSSKFKRLDSHEWIKSGEEWDVGFSKDPITSKSWLGVYFKDTSGRSWLRPLHTNESLYEAALVGQQILDIDDGSLLPYMVLTLEPKKPISRLLSKSSRSKEVELNSPPGW